MAFEDPTTVLATFGSSESQVAAKAVWRTRAQPPTPRQNSGPYAIEVPPEFQRAVQALMNEAAPALARGFNTHLSPVARNAFEAWPVRTGRSKASIGLNYFLTNGGDGFRGSIVVGAGYAGFITQKGSRARVANALLIRPFELAALRIAADAIDDLAKGAR